jgi:hypothetical protein
MISITSAPAAPPPRIRILDPTGGDVETVRIGDRLIFRIEIPGNSNMKRNHHLNIATLELTKLLLFFSSLRHFRSQLPCHGQRLQKYLSDHRRRRVRI